MKNIINEVTISREIDNALYFLSGEAVFVYQLPKNINIYKVMSKHGSNLDALFNEVVKRGKCIQRPKLEWTA